ncbi:MAG: hypothetical protein M3467_11715 [Actinomycetota bacterium]|nr:hypothetical protein [Actinomycetota bacterium]
MLIYSSRGGHEHSPGQAEPSRLPDEPWASLDDQVVDVLIAAVQEVTVRRGRSLVCALGVRSRQEAAALILGSRSGLGAGILMIPTDQWPGSRRPPAGP